MVGLMIASYVYYSQIPPFTWGKPTVEHGDVHVGVPFRVHFSVSSHENCSVDITRLAERTGANGGIIQLPPLGVEHKLIKKSTGTRASFYHVVFPLGTEPGRYRVFSRIRSDCTWRLWRHQMDTESVLINVRP